MPCTPWRHGKGSAFLEVGRSEPRRAPKMLKNVLTPAQMAHLLGSRRPRTEPLTPSNSLFSPSPVAGPLFAATIPEFPIETLRNTIAAIWSPC
jgi:hypothetical protein